MLEIVFAKPAVPKSGALSVLVTEDKAALWPALDQAAPGLARALAAGEFKGKKAQSCLVLAPSETLSRVVAVGLGKEADLTPRLAEEAGGRAASALAKDAHAAVYAGGLSPELAASVAMGAVLRSWRFDRYRTKEKPEDKPKLAKLSVLTSDPAKAKAAWEKLKPVAEGIFLTRELVSEPANVLFPASMADRAKAALTPLGVKVEVLGLKELTKLGFGSMLGVSQGSANEPRMVVMQWNGAGGTKGKKAQPVCFVGKGVTFDTGGISIKPAGGMEDMKWDMAGAGAVIGAMAALAGRKAKVDAVGLVGLVENMPSGTAQRPGDVVTSYSGQTIEVLNTDAEGRLVLADVLWYAQEKFNPRFMIDLATLTGAMIVALGSEYAGMFANDDALAQQLSAAGELTGERLWRFPMGESYDKMLKSDIADMKNISGGRGAGSITAAQFIQRFTNGKTWAHLDIAGVAWGSKDTATVPKGASAFGVRLLDALVAQNFEG